MRAKGTAFLIITALAAIAILVIGVGPAVAYEKYSEDRDATNCRACHGDFRDNNYISLSDGENWGDLHDLHRNTMLDGDCDTCHQSGGFFPVMIDDSAGGDGFESVGCIGCHGVDPDPGNPNDFWGAGLRLHHTNSGVNTCVGCHDNDPVPPTEDILPSYYFTPDANHPDKPTDPCNPSPGLPEDFAGLTMGLDNDGDDLYDEADPDCASSLIFADGFESGDTTAWSSQVP